MLDNCIEWAAVIATMAGVYAMGRPELLYWGLLIAIMGNMLWLLFYVDKAKANKGIIAINVAMAGISCYNFSSLV